jgi:hypothetical protein
MATGCSKADRNRRSASNTAYKAGKRQDVNAARKLKRHQKKCLTKVLNVPRGTARAARRAACMAGHRGGTDDFKLSWAAFRKMEARV